MYPFWPVLQDLCIKLEPAFSPPFLSSYFPATSNFSDTCTQKIHAVKICPLDGSRLTELGFWGVTSLSGVPGHFSVAPDTGQIQRCISSVVFCGNICSSVHKDLCAVQEACGGSQVERGLPSVSDAGLKMKIKGDQNLIT